MEALALYEHAQSNQTNLKHALADATEQLQEAMMAVHDTQRQLVDADFQLGRARHIARTSGYPEILTQEHPRILQVISYDGMTTCLLFLAETDSYSFRKLSYR
jgi:chromosome segregation ATPase